MSTQDEDPISIESLNRLTDRDNKAKIEQVRAYYDGAGCRTYSHTVTGLP